MSSPQILHDLHRRPLSIVGQPLLSVDDSLLHIDFNRRRLIKENDAYQNFLVGSRGEFCLIPPTADDTGDRGNVNFVPSLWPGRLALMIEDTIVNYMLDPSFEDPTATFWSGGSNSTQTASVKYAVAGVRSLLMTKTNAAGGGTPYRRTGTGIAAPIPVTAGNIYSTQCRALAEVELATGAWIRTVYYDGAGAVTGTSNSPYATGARGWEYIEDISTAPATSVAAGFYLFINTANPINTEVWWDAFQFEEWPHPTSYFDGDSGDGFQFTNDNHTTPSTRKENTVEIDTLYELVNEQPQLTHRFVVQPIWNQTTDINDYCNFLDYYGAGANDRFTFFWHEANSRFEMQSRQAGASQTLTFTPDNWTIGDWLDIVLTLDYTNDIFEAWFNGELVARSTGITHNPPTVDQWNLGSNYARNYQCFAAWAEYSLFNRILDPSEITGITLKPLSNGYAGAHFVSVQRWGPRAFNVMGSDAGEVYLGLGESFTDTDYTEMAESIRQTFAGYWADGVVHFAANMRGSDAGATAYLKLQYYDDNTAQWRDVPYSEITVTGTTYKRAISPPLTVPNSEMLYRIMEKVTADDTGYAYNPRILWGPGIDEGIS